MTHLATTPDARTRCGLAIDINTATTIRMSRVTCEQCRQPARTPHESIALAASQRGNFYRRAV